MPAHFERLATYNSERGRGLVHTEEYVAEMRGLQDVFNDWLARTHDVAVVPTIPYPTLPDPIVSSRSRRPPNS